MQGYPYPQYRNVEISPVRTLESVWKTLNLGIHPTCMAGWGGFPRHISGSTSNGCLGLCSQKVTVILHRNVCPLPCNQTIWAVLSSTAFLFPLAQRHVCVPCSRSISSKAVGARGSQRGLPPALPEEARGARVGPGLAPCPLRPCTKQYLKPQYSCTTATHHVRWDICVRPGNKKTSGIFLEKPPGRCMTRRGTQ